MRGKETKRTKKGQHKQESKIKAYLGKVAIKNRKKILKDRKVIRNQQKSDFINCKNLRK